LGTVSFFAENISFVAFLLVKKQGRRGREEEAKDAKLYSRFGEENLGDLCGFFALFAGK